MWNVMVNYKEGFSLYWARDQIFLVQRNILFLLFLHLILAKNYEFGIIYPFSHIFNVGRFTVAQSFLNSTLKQGTGRPFFRRIFSADFLPNTINARIVKTSRNEWMTIDLIGWFDSFRRLLFVFCCLGYCRFRTDLDCFKSINFSQWCDTRTFHEFEFQD